MGETGDFDDFVEARWSDLHAVAAVTTADPSLATSTTGSALASLARRWDEIVEDGTPTDHARYAVLTAALRAAWSATPGPESGRHSSADDRQADDPPADVRGALLTVLAGNPPAARAAQATGRAALAAEHFWGEGAAMVAGCAGLDTSAVVAERDALAGHLAAALGREPQEMALDLRTAVSEALDHVAADAPQVDPVALVAATRARTRRWRDARVLVAAAVVVLVAGAGFVVARPDPVPPAPGPTVVDATSATWATLTTWAPRGPLVTDPRVVRAVEDRQSTDPSARLLWAGTVGDTAAMVMSTTQPDPGDVPAGTGQAPDGGHVYLRLWTAPEQTDTLLPTTIGLSDEPPAADLVVLGIRSVTVDAPGQVLVLARPTVTEGFAVVGARPDPSGTPRNVVRALRFTGGVATYAESPGFASSVTVDRWSGPPAGVYTQNDPLPTSGTADDLAIAQRDRVATLSGYSAVELDSYLALDAVLEGPRSVVPGEGSLLVAVVATTTPDGSWVRTARVTGTLAGGGVQFQERLAVVPANDPTHALWQIGTGPHPTFVALAPDAATAEIVTADGRSRDLAMVRGGMALLSSTKDPVTTVFRLRLRAPDGHVVYDAVPPVGTELR